MSAAEPAEPLDLPPPPFADQPTNVRRGIVAFVVVMSALGFIGTALSPYLLVKYPLLLVALNPDGRHLLLVAPDVDFLTLLAVAAPRRVLALLATYGLAGLYGQQMVRYAEKRVKAIGTIARFLARALARVGSILLFVFPVHSLAGLSGAAGMRLRTFLLPISLGQVPFVFVYYRFGEAISSVTAQITAFLAANLVESTAVCIGLVLLQQIVTRLRRRRGEPGTDLESS